MISRGFITLTLPPESSLIGSRFCGACWPALGQISTTKPSGCDLKRARIGWQTYVNREHRFCVSIPSGYKRVKNPPTRDLLQFKRPGSDATISVSFSDEPFDLQSFVKNAPTGIESPPEPFRAGQNTFYHYGPGGGGVGYPDGFFFNLRGKVLVIEFDGPYIDDNMPILYPNEFSQVDDGFVLSEIGEGKLSENGWEKREFLALRFCGSRRKGSTLKNLIGALHINRRGCRLSVSREVKTKNTA